MDPAVKVDFFGLLQWGRNFIVAEMRRVAATITFQEMLQWGRNFIVAEMQITAMPASHISRCFNGAATLSLRKSITGEYGHALAAELQWGRNFIVAEISPRDRSILQT